jgi:hypothetical protein
MNTNFPNTAINTPKIQVGSTKPSEFIPKIAKIVLQK